MRYASACNRTLERVRDVRLHRDVGEALWAILAGEGEIHERLEAARVPSGQGALRVEQQSNTSGERAGPRRYASERETREAGRVVRRPRECLRSYGTAFTTRTAATCGVLTRFVSSRPTVLGHSEK